MSKTDLTKEIERKALRYFNKMGNFICPEVGISIEKEYSLHKLRKRDIENGYIDIKKIGKRNEIVDILLWESNKDNWKCFEIKISKNDFHSSCSKTFIGDYNYYIMTEELYEQVKDEIPKEIGVYTNRSGWLLYLRKKAKKQDLKIDKQVIYYSMIKSLYRESKK